MELALAENAITQHIYSIRGQKVMIDRDLATLYEVPVKRLNEQVRRNLDRFPADFMLQLTPEEVRFLRSQNATLKTASADRRGKHQKYAPLAFTEQGVSMLSSVLRSPRAVRVNIEIMRTFVRLRRYLATHRDLARRLDDLEQRYDGQFRVVFDAIRKLIAPPKTKPPRIGFLTQGEKSRGEPRTEMRGHYSSRRTRL